MPITGWDEYTNFCKSNLPDLEKAVVWVDTIWLPTTPVKILSSIFIKVYCLYHNRFRTRYLYKMFRLGPNNHKKLIQLKPITTEKVRYIFVNPGSTMNNHRKF